MPGQRTINDEKKSRESRSSRSHGDQDYRAKPSGSSKDRDRHSENYKSRSKKEGEKVDRQEERAAEHEAIRQHREGDVKDKERHRGNRDKRDRERDKEKERNDREHGERKHRDRDGHRDGDKENRDRDRERRREPKDMDKHREPDRERHRNDKDGERHKDDREKHRDDRERHKDDRRKHRDDREKHKDEREKHRDDRERYKEDKEKHRDDRERTGDRDKDRDRYRDEKDRKRSEREKRDRGDRDDRDHRKHRDDDKDRERVHREKNGEGNERRNRDKEAFGDSERRRGDREAVKDSEGRHKDSNERDRHHRYERESKGQNKDEEHRKLDREHRNKEGLRERRHKSSDRDHRDKDGSREQRHRSGDRGKGIRDERERGSKNVGGKEQYKESDQSHLNLADESIDSRSKSSSKRRQPSAKDVTPSDPEESHAAEEDEDYDDDFEEYDEDFEDFEDDDTDVKNMNSNEVDELFSAMNRENDRLLATSRHSESSDVTASSEDRVHIKRPATSRQRGFINFVAAKQRDMSHKTASKARKRCTELMKMIELDTVVLSLFDMPPVKEYDLYMSSFGRTNAQQVYIQTKDDNLDRDAQTEEIEFEDKWTQHPVEGRHACGGGSAVTERDDSTPNSGVEDGRLSSFLVRSCQVIEKLLAEEQSRSNFAQSSDSFSSSEAFTTLRQIEILRSRKVIACQFSPSDSNVVLTMHSPPTENVEKTIDKYGIIAIWNVNDPSKPQKLAVSACYPSCCCFSPMRPTLVFAGMLDGSVVAWDLREPKTMHHSHICGDKDWLLRLPTYNTAGVLQYSNHASPVRAIAPIISNTNKTSIQDSGLGISFQLASVEQDGVVNLWVVAEALETTQAGSESDLGLAPNGKLKLLKSSSIALQNPILNDLKMPFNALNMHISVINQNHFYIPTDSGSVIHGTRFGNQKTIPRGYSAHDFTPCRITSIDLHPKGHPVMVCGSENGTLQLYHLQSENPILSWDDFTNGAGIQKVLWSRNCSYVIFVLDTNSVIHMWDLLRNDLEPLASDSIPNKHVVDLTLSDETIAALKPKMALSFDDGGVEVHMLSSHVSTLQPGEDGQFVRYIEQL